MAPSWLKTTFYTMMDTMTAVLLRLFKMSKIYLFKFKARNRVTKKLRFCFILYYIPLVLSLILLVKLGQVISIHL